MTVFAASVMIRLTLSYTTHGWPLSVNMSETSIRAQPTALSGLQL